VTPAELKAHADLARAVLDAPAGEAGNAVRVAFLARGPSAVIVLCREIKAMNERLADLKRRAVGPTKAPGYTEYEG
jgi:hypothetical protein